MFLKIIIERQFENFVLQLFLAYTLKEHQEQVVKLNDEKCLNQ